MPLLVSVSDAEYTGIPVSLPFFAKLKQDLSVRIRYNKEATYIIPFLFVACKIDAQFT